MLHRQRMDLCADGRPQRLALPPVRAHYAHLYQFMRGETAIDFGKDAGRQASVADDHHRMKGMGASLEVAPLRRREIGHSLNSMTCGRPPGEGECAPGGVARRLT